MNPQGGLYYSEFQVPESVNRSPGSSRPGYGTIGGSMGQARRGLDSLGQPFQSSLQYGEERLGPYDRYDRVGPANSYMVDNSQAWGYNVATVNGAMNGANRYRQSSRRAAIPTVWTDQSSLSAAQPQLFPGAMLSQPVGLNGHLDHGMFPPIDPRTGMLREDKDQIIPTAIVIKNIPFSVRKEQLAQLMVDMQLPQPYAFNYHFDNGVFRGLAFANFQTPEETKIVIDAMNQMDVNGRKLRVEYKKMLPEHERERIEREKREKRGQLQEQHQPLTAHQQTSIPSLSTTMAASQPKNSPLRDVDLNNPETLQFYTELTLFKNDSNREIFIFPTHITPEQRRQIHILAHNLGLEHQSIGDGDSRQLQVFKRQHASPVSSLPTVSYDPHRRGLSRAATIDFAESRATTSGSYHTMSRPGPTLELPGSPDMNGLPNNLRAAKSFADLRSYSPSPVPSTSSYVNPIGSNVHVARYGEYGAALNNLTTPNLTPSTPGGVGMPTSGTSAETASLVSMVGQMALGFESTGSLNRPRDNPGAIGSQRPGANGTSSKPRAPGSEWESAGFGRGRANGHMPRGSDSSDGTRDNRSANSRMY